MEGQAKHHSRFTLLVVLVVCMTALWAIPAQSVVTTDQASGDTPWSMDQSGGPNSAPPADSSPGWAGPSTEPVCHPQILLVKFKPGVLTAQKQSVHAAVGATQVHRYNRISVDVVKIPQGGDLQTFIDAYESHSEVQYAEPNYTVKAMGLPNDPYFNWMWDMHNVGQTSGTTGADIGVLPAWDITTGSSSVVVGVVDTGIDYTHPDLAPNMWVNPNPTFGDLHGARWNNGDGSVTSGDPMDYYGHGTHVAGTIGAVANDGSGVVGVCPNVRLMALKFLDDSGSGYTADAVSALQYAIDHGANLTSNSWGSSFLGGGGYSQALHDMILSAGAANQLFIAAAGNDGLDNDMCPTYPADYDRGVYCADGVGCPNMIVVASSDSNDQISSFSNYGAGSVDIAAPGSNILSTVPGGGLQVISGTSMATPHVSGVAALLLSAKPGSSYQDLKGWILGGATPLSQWAGKVGTAGRLNAANSLVLAGATGAHLAISPYDRLAASGSPGGPFTPATQITYTLSNTSSQALNFTATASDNWVDVLPASGTIPASPGSAQITVSLNSNAQSLATGHHELTVTITDTTAGVAKTRGVTLDVYSDAVIRVKPDGNNANDGSSWALAKQTISGAVDAAISGREIWVKTGTYGEHAIQVKSGVGIYGGFAGTETLRTQRNWTANPTILDGGYLSNIVMGAPGSSSSAFDGFTVSKGYAPFIGGGLYTCHGNLAVANCTFTGNYAAIKGGALYVDDGNASIAACKFTVNQSALGGAVAIENSSSATVANCAFIANRAFFTGDTINTGFIPAAVVERSTAAFSNCTLAANMADLWCRGFGFRYTTTSSVTNCLCADSDDIGLGAGGGCATTYCCFPADYHGFASPGTGDILADPKFLSVPGAGPDGLWNTADDFFGDLRLQQTSPCIDAADNNGVPAGITTDLAGNPRFADDPNVPDTGSGTAPIVDMGVYEGATLVVATPQFGLNAGTYSGRQSVTITCPTSGATIHYTTNGVDPTTGDPTVASGGSVTVDSNLTLKAKAWATGLQASNVKFATYQIITDTPAFSPDGGIYQTQQQVVITCADAAATIHYTTNGNDPTTNDPIIVSGQSVAVSVSPTTTLKAKAWDASCYAPSAVKVAVYRTSAISIRVSPTGNDTNDGLSWSKPKLTVQAAIDSASSGDELWIAAGTYTDGITLKNGVSVYGGFAGNEASRSARNAGVNVTTMDYHGSDCAVLVPDTVGTTTVFDGFTVTSTVAGQENGWGLVCYGQPVVSNNTFTGWTSQYGASMAVIYVWTSGLPTFQSNRIVDSNYLPFCLYVGSAKIIGNYIGHCTGPFSGIYTTIPQSNTVISDNVVADNGSDSGNYAGIYVMEGNPIISNNTIVRNRVGSYSVGAGIDIGGGSPTIVNNIVAFNSAVDDSNTGFCGAGGIGVYDPGAVVNYNDVYGNTSSIPQYDNYLGVAPGAHDISVDPGLWDTDNGDYHLTQASGCIDAGWNGAPSLPATDADGKTRILDGNNDGTATVDMGAYEYRRFCVKAATGNDANDGSSWTLAKLTVAGALASATNGDEIWVAQGAYTETGLQLADGMKLLGGFSGTGTTRNWNLYTSTLNGPQNPPMVAMVTTSKTSPPATLLEGLTVTGTGWSCGGFSAQGSSTVRYNTFSNCVGLQGAGAVTASGSSRILNNWFSGNYSLAMGGAMIVSGSCSVTNNTFQNNHAYVHGGSIYAFGTPVISNNIIVGGTGGHGIYVSSGTPTLSHNDVYNNSPGNYYGVSAGTGDISADPTFTSAWHIPSTSPCVNAGDDNASGLSLLHLDMEGQSRIDGLHVDIGVDEVIQASPATISSCSPANGATNVPLSSVVSATFSQAMRASTITTATFLLTDSGSNPVVGTVTYSSATNVATFIPEDALAAGTTYTARVTAGVKDANGLNLSGDYTWSFTTSSQANHYMVKYNAPGSVHDGSSWNNAFLTITAGINALRAGDELWVAAGTYNEGVILKNGVGVYGGFAGSETSRSARSVTSNITKVNYNGYDAAVIAPLSAGPATVFDGFTLTTTNSSAGGSGVYCFGEPVISNNTITGWNAGADAFAIYVYTIGQPILQSNSIVNNTSAPIYLVQGSPQIIGNYIGRNTGVIGGIADEEDPDGMAAVNSGTKIVNNTIVGNGGGNSSVGGIFCDGYSSPVITNNTIVGNQVGSSGWGGGIAVFYGHPSILNNIVANNSAVVNPEWTSGSGGGGINVSGYQSTTVLDYNDVYGNTSSNPLTNDYNGMSPGAHDISVDPGFWDKTNGDYHLTYGSGCIDTGLNTAAGIQTSDADGKTRILDGNYDGTATVDMGAYEYRRFYLSTSGSDSNNGSSWSLAKLTVGGAVASATSGDEIWVASGSYAVSGSVLKSGMKLLGGFSGSGVTRSWSQYVTTLSASGSPVTTDSSANSATLLEGFTLTGYSWNPGGGCAVSGSPIIRYNFFNGCHGGYGGGAICVNWNGSPLIVNNVFTGNLASGPGGAIVSGGSPTITNNTFTNNHAYAPGGTIYITTAAVISNNIIVGSTSGYGIYSTGSGSTLSHNDVYGNSPANYYGISAGTGDISADPLIIGLWTIASTSPCVNAGDDNALGLPLLDMDGQGRIYGAHVDIGADEYQP